MAELTLVIGANGAGKSTWCRLYAQTLPRYFYDADSIAQGLGSYNDPELQRAARALVDERIQTHLDRRDNFGFESTYSGASRPAIVRKAKTLGYRTSAIFIGTHDVGINVERVAKRVVSRVGHHVPEEEIKRRWYACQRNLARTWNTLDDVLVLDNSRAKPRAIGSKVRGSLTLQPDAPHWAWELRKEILTATEGPKEAQ